VIPLRDPASVLFVITESVRASDYHAGVAPRVAALLPERVELGRMRAVASYTSLSVAALFTGRAPTDALADRTETPTVFDYARASGLRTAYLGAHLASVFEGREVRGALDVFVTLETLVGRPLDDEEEVLHLGLDRMLAARALADLPRLTGPSFVVLHFAGTHAPYFVDPSDAPFVPYDDAISWQNLPRLHNAYKNAIHGQDALVAACVEAFIDARKGAPWVVVFTSDHGEAFGEHAAIHHGQNLYDEQLRVPAFLAHGAGGLDGAQDTALHAGAARASTHLDLVPTLLDAVGVLDAPALAPHVARLAGRSLLRSHPTLAPLPISNCTSLFPCPLDTWGMLGEDRKLVAQPWDGTWRCTRLDTDAETEAAAEDAQCQALAAAARPYFPRLPNGHPSP